MDAHPQRATLELGDDPPDVPGQAGERRELGEGVRGEAIRLQLTFTADKPGYKVETSADTAAPQTDRISVTPDDGLFHWKDRLEPRPFPVDSVVVTDLSTSPATVEVPLNKTVRFDKPGDYRVRVTTRRVSPDGFGGLSRSTISLATNEVTFHVELMTDAEGEQRVLELRSLLAYVGLNLLQQIIKLTGTP